ncbi:MAG: flippase-like domain-containing protein [Anaerolineaceae bacterium]|nr:MAG: flippase-like domain-containing protein [Anaerolineaceae bacterium]
MKRWQFWLGILISVIFVWMALRGLSLDRVWLNIRNANYWWLFPSVLVYFVAVWARTWRWGYMLRPLKRVSTTRLFPVVVIGYMGNNIFPFRAGELLRSYVLRLREDIPISASIATVVVERVFDGLVMLAFVFIALPLTPIPGDDDGRVRAIVTIASGAFFLAMVVFFIMAAFPDQFYRLAKWFGDRLLPEKIANPLLQFLRRFLSGLESLRSFRSVLMIFFTSVIIWLLETVKYWFIMQAFDFQVTFFALMLMNGVVNLATTLPSAPGYVGTFDEPGIEILKLYGVEGNIAAAYTLVLHVALWMPITILGGYFMIREGLSLSALSQAMQGSEEEVIV